jgi:hypothetical protein
VNRYAHIVDRSTVDWAYTHGLLPGAHAGRRLAGVGVGSLIGRAYPATSQQSLQLLADWTTWLFVLDDRCDERSAGKDPAALRANNARTLDILRGTPVRPQDGPLAHALIDLRRRMLERGSAEWLARFIVSVAQALDASVWEATNRAHRIVPDLISYLEWRPATGGMLTYVELSEITDGIDLPIAIRYHALVQRLTRMAINVVCWANDVLSLQKELKQGDVHNLVLVLQRQQGLTLQEALERVAALHDVEVRAFMDVELSLPSFDPASDSALGRYIDLLRSWMRGNLDWSYTSGRYFRAMGIGRGA